MFLHFCLPLSPLALQPGPGWGHGHRRQRGPAAPLGFASCSSTGILDSTGPGSAPCSPSLRVSLQLTGTRSLSFPFGSLPPADTQTGAKGLRAGTRPRVQRVEPPRCRRGCRQAGAFRRRGAGGRNYHGWRRPTHTNSPDLNLNLTGASSPEARAVRWEPRSQGPAAPPPAQRNRSRSSPGAAEGTPTTSRGRGTGQEQALGLALVCQGSQSDGRPSHVNISRWLKTTRKD